MFPDGAWGNQPDGLLTASDIAIFNETHLGDALRFVKEPALWPKGAVAPSAMVLRLTFFPSWSDGALLRFNIAEDGSVEMIAMRRPIEFAWPDAYHALDRHEGDLRSPGPLRALICALVKISDQRWKPGLTGMAACL